MVVASVSKVAEVFSVARGIVLEYLFHVLKIRKKDLLNHRADENVC